jgi:phenylacetate-CoA ligase
MARTIVQPHPSERLVPAAAPAGGKGPPRRPWTPKSGVTGIAWPALPTGAEALRMAVIQQLERTQWWPPEALLAMQMRQLALLAKHAAGTVPFYRDRLAAVGGLAPGELIAEAWRRVPVLTRAEVQEAGRDLVCTHLPPGHGKTHDILTSGSTGAPVRAKGTEVNRIFRRALNLRNHLWHRRDFTASMAVIKELKGAEAEAAEADKPTRWAPVYRSGTAWFLDVRTPVSRQLEWLVRRDPDYLLTYPSNLHALIKRSEETGSAPTRLRDVGTMAEILQPEHRAACERGWGVPVKDVYSSQELGFIAVQCPEHPHYLVQAESLYVEILDAKGHPCGPGKIGRVVITDLHNFATPLIRYELGDYAEVGAPCPTGRGLPVLSRILGRSRNMLRLPSGDEIWPNLQETRFLDVAPVRQYQLIQRSLEEIEVTLAVAEPLAGEQKDRLARVLQVDLGYPFRFAITEVDEIPRAPNGKYEDFLCEVP